MIKVMIVDDERTTREGLSQYIPWREIGIDRVILSENGAEALEILETEPVDILLCDIKMPRMDGITLCKTIREFLPECKIVFVTAYADIDNLKNAIDLKVVKFLEKPIQRLEIKRIMQDLIAQIRDERREHEKLYESAKLLTEQLAYILIHGVSAERAEELCSHAGIDLSNIKCYQTAIISLGEREEQNSEHMLLDDVRPLFSCEAGQSIACFYDRDNIVVHMIDCSITPERAEAVSKEARKIFGENFSFVSFGKVVADITQVKQSYITAALALQRKFFSDEYRYEIYEESGSPPFGLEDSQYKKLENMLEASDYEEIRAFFEDVRVQCTENKNIVAANVKAVFQKLARIAHNHSAATGLLDNIDDFDNETYLDKITFYTSFSSLYEYVLSLFGNLCTLKEEKYMVGNLVANVLKYIDKNFSDNVLSIQKLAEHVNITTNYLCYIFKAKTGKTVHQYITETRMEYAKELLLNGRLKLYDIALRVGCVNGNHFSKLFKTQVGVNPSVYREKYSK